MATCTIAELRAGAEGGYCPRGAVRDLWRSRHHEVIVSGPAETGKTYGCCQKLDALLWKYAGAVAVMIRKTLASLYPSVLKTYRNVLGPESPVRFYGGEKPEWADYPNGSRLYFAGIDNPQKALSSERDFIYVNQAEELDQADWEVLTTRATGRAGGAPYAQVLGDCNPGPPTHWILHRPSLKVLESRHEDNPALFDDAGNLTAQGERSLAVLDRLTGARKDRLRFGRWAQAEGVVYEAWDRRVHLVDRFPIPPDWRRIRSLDWGYTNPFSCLWVAIDPDGRMYLYREIYMTSRTVAVHCATIKQVERWELPGPGGRPIPDPDRERIEASVADTDAGDRATAAALGIPTVAAIKDVSRGIQAVQERLKPAGDGKPRLFVMRDSLIERDPARAEARRPCCAAEEFDSYCWAKAADVRPSKEEPLKLDDHAMDALRYAVMREDGRRKVEAW